MINDSQLGTSLPLPLSLGNHLHLDVEVMELVDFALLKW